MAGLLHADSRGSLGRGGRQIVARGDVVLVALHGDAGKPRPAVVVQSEQATGLFTVVVCPLTTTTRDDLPAFRVSIAPNPLNGLLHPSQVMVDKPSAPPRDKLRNRIGQITDDEMAKISAALSALLGL